MLKDYGVSIGGSELERQKGLSGRGVYKMNMMGGFEVTDHTLNLGNFPEINSFNFNLVCTFLIIASILAYVHSAHLDSIQISKATNTPM